MQDPCVLVTGVLLTMFLVVVIGMISQKAGYSFGHGLLMVVPVVNLFWLLWLAFAEWPIQRTVKVLGDWRAPVVGGPGRIDESKRAGSYASEIERLVEELKDPREHIRWAAAKKLGEMGGAAHAALPALHDLLQDRDSMIRQAAQDAIRLIDPEGLGAEKGAEKGTP